MKRKHAIYKWLIAILLICSGAAVSPVAAFPQTTTHAAWSTTPVMSQDVCPAYQFRSTSTCMPVVGQTSYTSSASYSPIQSSSPNRMRRGIDDEDPEGDEVGMIDTPVGEPFVLLLLAIGYFLMLRNRRLATKITNFKKKS